MRVHAILTNLQLTLCVGPQRDHRCLVWLTSVHDSSQEDENVKSQRRRTPSDGTTLSDELWKLYSPGCMVGALMSVGVMTVGVMSVGEITVGVMSRSNETTPNFCTMVFKDRNYQL